MPDTLSTEVYSLPKLMEVAKDLQMLANVQKLRIVQELAIYGTMTCEELRDRLYRLPSIGIDIQELLKAEILRSDDVAISPKMALSLNPEMEPTLKAAIQGLWPSAEQYLETREGVKDV